MRGTPASWSTCIRASASSTLPRPAWTPPIGVSDGHWTGLMSHHLHDEQLVPVISPALVKTREIRRPADLSQHLLLQVTARPDTWRQWFVSHGLELSAMRIGPQFELTSHLIQAVASGIGVGLLPSFLVEDELRSGVLSLALDLPFASGMGCYLHLPPHTASWPPLAAFREWLLEIKDATP